MSTRELISGYATYSSLSELNTINPQDGPAISPTTSVTSVTASSPECVAFTVSLSAGGTGATIALGC